MRTDAEKQSRREQRRRYRQVHKDICNEQKRRWAKRSNGKASITGRQRSIRAWLNQIKLSRGCADCGYNASPVALEFDHRNDTTKRYNVGAMTPMSKRAILAEIEKCDVVCANCHAIRTHILRKNHQLSVRARNETFSTPIDHQKSLFQD